MARVPIASLPEGTVVTTRGTPVSGAQVQVLQHGTQTPVTVYGDETSSATLTQPLSTSALGAVPGYLDDGQTVDLVATVGGLTYPAVEANVVRGDTAGSAGSLPPSGDATGAADTLAIQAKIDAANTAYLASGRGQRVRLAGGVFWTTGLTHRAGVLIEGESRAQTIVRLAAGANRDLLVTEGFATNTGTANNGPQGFALARLTLDANRTAQTAQARCWAVYGYNYTVDNVWFVNGYGGGVYSEWGGPDNPMETQWRDWKIWGYGGAPGAVGLDWNGPHDAQIGTGVIATLDSTIRTTDVSYGATPINGSAVNFPGPGNPFTFVTTAAAPTASYPATGGSFLVKTQNSLETWAIVSYTSASTVGAVTTFSGCTCPVGGNRTVVANDGIVVPSYGLRVNGGPANHGESGLQLDTVHVWGRNHFGIFPNAVPVYASNCEIEGAFVANLILTTNSLFTGVIYGTLGQAGQTNEAGIQIGTTTSGCRTARVDAVIYNIGGASSANGASVGVVSSLGYNVVRVTGTTSAANFAPIYGGSSDRFETYCQNVTAKSSVVDNTGIAQHMGAALRPGRPALTYAASITPNAAAGQWQTVTVTDANAFTINAPSSPPTNFNPTPIPTTQELTIEVFNNSAGAMGAITWNAAFVFAGQAWANPAAGKRRFARFEWNGSSWVCTGVAAADY